ncbi:unnamed protein product [Linum trigynum]|uniref:Uncharacterized protein n=1 Tax=Linum trigynum TaxID=586398 RepID=A0AAV2D842_9ROSI
MWTRRRTAFDWLEGRDVLAWNSVPSSDEFLAVSLLTMHMSGQMKSDGIVLFTELSGLRRTIYLLGCIDCRA